MTPFIIATIGSATGAKTHEHPLGEAGQALVGTLSGGIYVKSIATPTWTSNRFVAGTRTTPSVDHDFGTPLAGETDLASTVQPSFVCRYIIRAA